MNIIDISWPITENMTRYKDQGTVSFTPISTFEKDGARKTQITLDTHTGTHIDAPSHFLKDGITTERVAIEQYIGPCVVLDLSHVQEKVTAADLEQFDLSECDAVLIKTTNSHVSTTGGFDPNFVYLDVSAAEYLSDLGIEAVGFDYLGIERNQPAHDTHVILLKAGIVIVEGLRLAHVMEGDYFFVCLPLAVQKLDGAPARAILVSDLE